MVQIRKKLMLQLRPLPFKPLCIKTEKAVQSEHPQPPSQSVETIRLLNEHVINAAPALDLFNYMTKLVYELIQFYIT
jgi:hypothetical protein